VLHAVTLCFVSMPYCRLCLPPDVSRLPSEKAQVNNGGNPEAAPDRVHDQLPPDYQMPLASLGLMRARARPW
jgi:hypothetical protein